MRGYLLLLLLWALAAAPVVGQPGLGERIAQAVAEKGKSDTERLHALFALHTEIGEETSPENNTWLGKPKHQDQWTDMSLPAIGRRNETQRQLLEATKQINRSQLSKPDQLNT